MNMAAMGRECKAAPDEWHLFSHPEREESQRDDCLNASRRATLPAMRKMLVPLLLILVLAAAGWWWLQQRDANGGLRLVLHGNVDVRQIALAFDINGRILELHAEEGDAVRQGEEMGELDTHVLQLQARQAKA